MQFDIIINVQVYILMKILFVLFYSDRENNKIDIIDGGKYIYVIRMQFILNKIFTYPIK